MPESTPTPGQRCYAAYVATLPYAEPWSDLSAAAQTRWEAAAQAVRMAYKAEMAAAWQHGVVLWQEEDPHADR